MPLSTKEIKSNNFRHLNKTHNDMREYTLKVDKDKVYNEVALRTAYVGAKTGDEASYKSIAVTEYDNEMLDRFWNESKHSATHAIGEMLKYEEEDGGIWEVTVSLPQTFNESLLPTIVGGLSNFFITNIAAKWYVITNKADAADTAASAVAILTDVVRALMSRVRPSKPEY